MHPSDINLIAFQADNIDKLKDCHCMYAFYVDGCIREMWCRKDHSKYLPAAIDVHRDANFSIFFIP